MQTASSPQKVCADRARPKREMHWRLLVLTAILTSTAPAEAQRLLGLDVSTYQGDISITSWATLKRPTTQSVDGTLGDGRDFVFIRASRGGTTGQDHRQGGYSVGDNTFSLSERYDDPYFVQNITRATNAGMYAGSYHFSRPDVIASTQNANNIANTGTDEADHFIQMAGAWMRPGYLLPVHDFEAGDGFRTNDQLAQFCIDFSDRIYSVMGVRPIIYVNGNYAGIIGNASVALRTQIVSNTPLWNARYANNDDPASIPVQTGHPKDTFTNIYGPWDDAPNPTHPWRFWQYASKMFLNGNQDGKAFTDVDVIQGGIEFLKDQLVPAVWMTNSSGQWTTLTNWNSGIAPTAPVQGTGQLTRVGPLTLPAVRLPASDDTVVLDRPNANVNITLASGTYTIRKLYNREVLNLTGGSLTVGYVPTSDSTPIAAQFSGPVTLSGTASFSVHTLQVDAAQTFTLAGGTLTFNTINLMPHATTPAKILVSGDVTVSGLGSVAATIANGTGSGSSGLVDLGGATRTFDVVNVISGTDLAVEVPITNGSLTKINTGTLGLNAANTYTGTTTVQAGRIELGGSLNGGVTVTGTGVLAFGATTGIRMANGSLAVNAGGTFRVRVNGPTTGTDYDQLKLTNAASSVTLAGTLDLIAAPGLAVGSTFCIIDNSASSGPVAGTFAGLPQNSEFFEDGQWWKISYTGGTGNDVVLTRVASTQWHAWLTTNFPADLHNPAVIGDFVDVEHDGLVNRIEYAFGGNPMAAAQSPLPAASLPSGRLAINFTRIVANTDLTLTVQGADEPAGGWTNLASSTAGGATIALLGGVTVSETGSGATRSVQVRDLYTIGDPAHPKRFLRVQVTRP